MTQPPSPTPDDDSGPLLPNTQSPLLILLLVITIVNTILLSVLVFK